MNEHLFEKTYEEHKMPLTLYALRMLNNIEDAQDVVQQVFVAVWDSYNQGKEISNLKYYLYTSVKNRCISLAKQHYPTVDIEEYNAESGISEDDIDTAERDSRLWKAIENLPSRCRQVFLLSKRDHLSQKEIAKEMGISVKTVENQITKALKQLREAYGLSTKTDNSTTISIFFLSFL